MKRLMSPAYPALDPVDFEKLSKNAAGKLKQIYDGKNRYRTDQKNLDISNDYIKRKSTDSKK